MRITELIIDSIIDLIRRPPSLLQMPLIVMPATLMQLTLQLSRRQSRLQKRSRRRKMLLPWLRSVPKTQTYSVRMPRRFRMLKRPQKVPKL